MSENFWKRKKVFLTGHTGFKGAWLSFWLLQKGASLKGYALVPDSDPALFNFLGLNHKMESVLADIRDGDRLKSEMQTFSPDVVLHLAAQPLVRASYANPVETYTTNVMGTINFLEALRACPTVRSCVVITTDKVYENFEVTRAYKEEDPLGGYDPYSSSKACTEIVTSSWKRSFFGKGQTLIATARAGNVIGGGDWAADRLIPDFVRAMNASQTVQIRNPHSIRPWQHVLEPLSGYLRLAELLFQGKTEAAQAFNFGPLEEDCRTVGEIVALAEKAWAPKFNANVDRTPQPHEAGYLKLNATKAGAVLQWHPKWNLETTVQRTLDWYAKLDQGESAEALCLADLHAFEAT